MHECCGTQARWSCADDDDIGASQAVHEIGVRVDMVDKLAYPCGIVPHGYARTAQAGRRDAVGSVIESIVSTAVASARPSKVSTEIERPLRETT